VYLFLHKTPADEEQEPEEKRPARRGPIATCADGGGAAADLGATAVAAVAAVARKHGTS
jgi:hypothetical protein